MSTSSYSSRGRSRLLALVFTLLISIPILISAAPAQADPLPQLSINNVVLDEGNSGTTTFSFTVSLDSPAPVGGVTFDITTMDGTSIDASATTGDGDYVAKSLTGQTIPAGSSSYTFDVTVNGDAIYEVNETFVVVISNVVGATLIPQDPQYPKGVGAILNDDSYVYPTTTMLANYPSLSAFGQLVTIEARVSTVPLNMGNPTGTVTFAIDGIPQAPVMPAAWRLLPPAACRLAYTPLMPATAAMRLIPAAQRRPSITWSTLSSPSRRL
jgi:hypothetical protein